LIADSITQQLEKRIMFRRAMKRAMQNAMRMGAQGIKLMSSGRLNGIEIARCEWYREGRVPLHTLKADIDYGFSEASTTYGIIGVKCWVYRGDRLANGDSPGLVTPHSGEDDRRQRRNPRNGPSEGRVRPAGTGGNERGVARVSSGERSTETTSVESAKSPAVKRIRKLAMSDVAAAKGE
jgi:small subunit ribosomal protein S3